MNAWQQELLRCRVAKTYREIDIFWIEDPDYHQHVEVYGRLDAQANLETVGDAYCHGFHVWACDCPDHDDPEIVAGWCRVPKHATEVFAGEMFPGQPKKVHAVTITRTRKNHPKFNVDAVCYQLRIPDGMVFEVYDKPHNVGMVIIRPVSL